MNTSNANSILKKIDLYVFLALIFVLPFGKDVFIPTLFVWLCLVFISYFVYKDYLFSRFRSILILPVLFYLVHLGGIVLSTNKEAAFFDLEMKLSLLFLPLLYPYNRELYKANYPQFYFVFVAGSFFNALFLLSHTFTLSFTDGFPTLTECSQHCIGVTFSYLMHPSYLALYITTSILFIVFKGGTFWRKNKLNKALIVFTLTILFVTLILLQSRAGILSVIFLFLYYFLYTFFVKKVHFLYAVIFIVGTSLFIYFTVKNNQKIVDTVEGIKTISETGINSADKGIMVRVWIWKAAVQNIKKHPMVGVGTGDIIKNMNAEFEKTGMDDFIPLNFNTHNQFLETWLGTGILGLLLLLCMMFIPIWVAFKKREMLVVLFFGICIINFLFESMLNTIAGVVFFAIMYVMLTGNNIVSPQVEQTLN